jgi:crotonobetainyl-CoA:carnitine CoA-transferase CaiB-like acyl-CoA transferase
VARLKASPGRRLYRCKGGGLLGVDCRTEEHWWGLAKCVGRPELAYAGDWAAASEAPVRGRLGRLLEEIFREDPAEVWVARLEAHGVPCRVVTRGRRAS